MGIFWIFPPLMCSQTRCELLRAEPGRFPSDPVNRRPRGPDSGERPPPAPGSECLRSFAFLSLYLPLCWGLSYLKTFKANGDLYLNLL